MWRRFIYTISSTALSLRILIGVIIWTIFISSMHYELNFDHGNVKTIKMGYMPVVTNMAVPLLDYASQNNNEIRFKALKFSSFAEMGESLRNGEIDVAFIIAPLSIVLRQQGEDIKIVYIGNRHESTFVTRKNLNIKTIEDLVGKTIAVPMRFSGHNLSVLELLDEHHLKGRINVVEMNPPDMASALMSGSLDAYYVGEPFAAQTLKNGNASLFSYAEDLWKDFICNVAIVRQDLIERDADTVKLLVEGAARSGLWAQKNTRQAVDIVSSYWNQSPDLVKYTLNQHNNRTVYNLFTPRDVEMQKMADIMKKHDLITSSDISGLVEDRFARAADTSNVTTIESIIKNQN